MPTKLASPVNVTTPVEVLTEYEPSFVIVTDVSEQFGAVSVVGRQSRTELALIVVPEVAVSFDDGVIVIAAAFAPDAVSARAVGGTAH